MSMTPKISTETEKMLHEAFMAARRLRHRIIGPEHLLERLLDDASVTDWLTSKGIDVDRLRASLEARLANVDRFSDDEEPDTLPTDEFQRVIRRALLRVESAEHRGKVTNLVVLHALLESPKALSADLGLSKVDTGSSQGSGT